MSIANEPSSMSRGARKPILPKKSRIPDEYTHRNNFRFLEPSVGAEPEVLNAQQDLGIGVFSEIGRLRKVFVHSPGPEVELMTPKTASELLYNDIIHYRNVRSAHAELKSVLGLVSEVLEVKTCLAEVLDIPTARVDLLTRLTAFQKCTDLLNDLLTLPSTDLAEAIVCGVPLSRNSLESFLDTRSFSIVPLPNMYFMRDSSVVVGNRLLASAMASGVRHPEALIMRTIYEYHPSLRGKGMLLDACSRVGMDKFTIEGGDVLVINDHLLLVGISERTTPKALDALVEAFSQARKQDKIEQDFNVLCVILPQERSTIHLDMIFTAVGPEQALVYAPYILGRERSRVVRIRVKSNGAKKYSEVDDLLMALKSVGVRMDPILCGGDSALHQQREQWNSGANMFAIAPRKVLSYDMHEYTVRACEDAGFKVASASEVVQNPSLVRSSDPLVITVSGTELARGGGGPRCMTCPVLRDPV